MAFVQIIEMQTSKFDEVKAVGDDWEAAIGDARTAVRRVLCKDRDNPGHYVNIVFFDSYESAMENSDHAATQELSAKMADLLDAPPRFHNLDVVDEQG
jgi:quinol monooxygenase YgiN